MIVNMSEKATEQQIAHIIERIREAGYQPHLTRGVERTIVAAVGNGRRHEIEAFQASEPAGEAGTIAGQGGRGRHWWTRSCDHCRTLLGGIAPTVAGHSACSKTRRGNDVAGWGVQTANLSL